MAEAGDKGIPLEDYIKLHEPEPLVRVKLDRGQRRYAWVDADGNARASDDGGSQPPKGWWLATLTTIDCERRSVRGCAFLEPTFPPMFFVRVFPAVTPAAEHPAQEAPRRGRPSSASLVLEEAERRLRSSDKALYIRRGRENFLAGLSDWLRDTHPKARPMAPKTIGDHLRENANVRALLPESWFRRK
jgi:hypothetical protein